MRFTAALFLTLWVVTTQAPAQADSSSHARPAFRFARDAGDTLAALWAESVEQYVGSPDALQLDYVLLH